MRVECSFQYITSTNPRKLLNYFLSSAIDAFTAMYLYDGKKPFLDEAIKLIDNVKSTAVSYTPSDFSGFTGTYYSWPGNNMRPTPLYESVFWRYVTVVLRIIRQKGGLWHNPTDRLPDGKTYQQKYYELLEFVETHIFNKWLPSNLVYRHTVEMSAHWAFIAANIYVLSTNNQIKNDCKKVYDKFNNDFLNQIKLHRSSVRTNLYTTYWEDKYALIWDEIWIGNARIAGTKKTEQVIADLSHSNFVIAHIIEDVDYNHLFWNKILKAWIDTPLEDRKPISLTLTFTNLICEKSDNGPLFSKYIDGLGRTFPYSYPPGDDRNEHGDASWLPDGWLKLGRYSTVIQKIYEDIYNKGDVHKNKLQFYANACLNAKILGYT